MARETKREGTVRPMKQETKKGETVRKSKERRKERWGGTRKGGTLNKPQCRSEKVERWQLFLGVPTDTKAQLFLARKGSWETDGVVGGGLL
ncbi:hypothetical protein Pcinc_013861 [Petrolisthes cinctipes]|uniref:Uncharacterized protein n=1 Tax=Petrolisthes cinctipes TaxID=88211 RepID=A0AAE1KPU6_PETCI|nr:hypothetical protein Pcinc_013861 [Petrolisthes cinctipes]